MFSKNYPSWGCRCCVVAEGGKPNVNWNVYAVNKDFEAKKTQYYQEKAKFDTIKAIINQGEAQIVEEEAKINVVELNTDEMAGINEAIKKYACYK
jgi:hypothetical protein